MIRHVPKQSLSK